MTDKYDFERAIRDSDFEQRWLSKFLKCLDEAVCGDIRNQVMEGAEKLVSGSSDEEVIEWTCEAINRLEALVEEEIRKEVLTGCACQYPKQRLEHLREKYAETEDLDLVHRMLQEQFLSTTRAFLELDEEQLNDIKRRGWGVAGLRKGDIIIATKMPFEFHEYFEAATPEERRYQYCHCPRIREVIKTGEESISTTYCYCGAGFYKGIWEYILQRPVKVEVGESVLQGDDVCRIAIHLTSET